MDYSNIELIPLALKSMADSAPMLTLIIAGLVMLGADIFLPREKRGLLPRIGVAGLVVALLAQLFCVGYDASAGTGEVYFGALVSNSYIVYLSQFVILSGGLFLFILSPRYFEGKAMPMGEYYAISLFAVASMLALAASSELLTLFLNIEIVSIALYVLAGLEKRNANATEAAFKYFLLGSFAAAFLLFGIAFVFGATGELKYSAIAAALQAGNIQQPVFLTIGFGMILIGFAFKLTLAPFHMYAPDVYDGAPSTVGALIATGTKVAGFVALFHVVRLMTAWEARPEALGYAMAAVTIISAVVGNLGAIVQPRFKRMLAYSSIAHSAYVLIPMIAMYHVPAVTDAAEKAVAYYALAYTVMTLLAFGVAITLREEGEGRIADFAGLVQRRPAIAVFMAFGLFSLLGIPPTIGFLGKYLLFAVAIEADQIYLAVTLILASVASAYYYLNMIVTMFMKDPAPQTADAGGASVVPRVNFWLLAFSVFCIFYFALHQAAYLIGG